MTEKTTVNQKETINLTEVPAKLTQQEINRAKQEDKSKCWNCTKKVGLMGFECQCGFTFCKKHRMPESHECDYDFITHGKKALSENNPQIKTEKIEKI